MSNDNNPLLHVQFRIPFDCIHASDVEPAIAELLSRSRIQLDDLAGENTPHTWANTMATLDDLAEPLDWAMGIVRHLEAVVTYPEPRAAHNAVEPLVSAFYTSIPLHPGLWRNIKAYAATEDARALTGTRHRFLQKTIDTFRRQGADLDAPGKARLEKIDVDLALATTKFSEHVLDSTNAWDLVITDQATLAGLPPTALAMARQSAMAIAGGPASVA